jgi:hypothetical protein
MSKRQSSKRLNWWWRDIPASEKRYKAFHIVWSQMKAEVERSAWFYELEKRVTGNYRFGKPYVALSVRQLMQLRWIWPISDFERKKNCVVTYGDAPAGWRNWSEPLSFNLLHHPRTIERVLRQILNKVRGEHGIKLNGRAPSKGERRKSLSWSIIELFDDENAVANSYSTNDSRRKMKSKARIIYRENTPSEHLCKVILDNSQTPARKRLAAIFGTQLTRAGL